MEIRLNGEGHALDEGSSIADLLDALERNSVGVAVAVNLQVIPRKEHPSRLLEDGDRVDLVTAVGGG